MASVARRAASKGRRIASKAYRKVRGGGLAEIRETQLHINHLQTEMMHHIDERIKNSGTVALSETELLTKIFSGLKMYLDPRDLTVVPHLALDAIWEHDITAAWLKVLQPSDIVFDIGANFGYFGALAGQRTDAKAQIHFFEANPKLMPYMHKTLAANWLDGKSVVKNVAVADKPGEVTFRVSPHYLGSASLSHDLNNDTYEAFKIDSEELDEVTVPAVTVDDYCKEQGIKKIDLIKMDIEGFEDKAYQGMRKIVKNSPRISLFIEFTKQGYKAPEAFYDRMLKDFGHVYTITKDGEIKKRKTTTYKAVIGSGDSWVMPIFSKRPDLERA